MTSPKLPREPDDRLAETVARLDEQQAVSEWPQFGTEDYRIHAVLFNDVTHAPLPSDDYFRFSDRIALAAYLWKQGWRRDVRPEDVTEGRDNQGDNA